MEKLKNGDIILIKEFQSQNNIEFYCYQHFKDLIGLPTRVSVHHGENYVTHPVLDSVPLNKKCVDFDILESSDELSHRDFKTKLQTYKQMMGGHKSTPKNLDKLKHFFLKKNINESENELLTPKQKKLIDLVDKLQNGDFSMDTIENLIGDFGLLMKKLNDEGILSYIDPFDELFANYQNAVFYHFYQSDPSFIWKLVDKYFSDVTKIGDTYYYDADYSDLGSLFNTGRSDISSDTISEILSGEYDSHRYGGYDTDDVYRDVYDELTPEKKQLVNNRIREELKQMGTIDTNTNELEVIASEQGRDDIELTDDIITRILEDEDTMVYLINRELDDIRSDLGYVYEGCYSTILVDGWYNDLWGALEGVVVDSKEGLEYSYKKNVWNKTGGRETKTVYSQRYPATNTIYYVVSNWLKYNKDKNGYSDNSLEYFGSYYNLLEDSIEYDLIDDLRVPRLDDYPDFREMKVCINDGISEYF